MSEVIKTFDFNFKGRYPWDEWLGGQIWKLVEGKDFTQPARSFRSGSIPIAAARRGLKVRTRVVDEGQALVIQAYKA